MRIKDDKKIENIKEAAMKLVEDLGFHGTSVSKIAKVAGVSPATIYIYYDNKEDMLKEIYLELKKNLFAYIFKNITDDMGAKETFYYICKAYYEYIDEHNKEYNFIKQYKSCPALIHQCKKEMDYFIKMNNLLDGFKSRGIIKNVDNLIIVTFLLFTIEGIHDSKCKAMISNTNISLDDVCEMIWDGIRLN